MRSAILILAALALGAEAAAQDVALLGGPVQAAPAQSPPVQPADAASPLELPVEPPAFAAAPFVGVERSSAFRLSDRRRLMVLGRPEPLSFGAQADAGLTAFHLTVYADPDAGRYARGGARGDLALSQAGLKVVDPEAADGGAVCATLMTCLIAIDAVAQSADGSHVVVVVDARPEPAPEPRLLRIADALIDPPIRAPSWEAILTEIAVALPDIDPARLSLVVAGGAGEPPDPAAYLGRAAAAVLLDGGDARVFRADADPAAVGEAVMSGALAVVIGADASGEGDPARLGPREAAALGAQVVLVTPRTARSAPSPS